MSIRLGNIAPCRDYIDTRDIAEADPTPWRSVARAPRVQRRTGVAHSVQDIVESLEPIRSRPITVVQDPSRVRATERMVLVADMSKIRRATAWSPRVSLEDTLRDLVAAYGLQTQPHWAT